MDSEVIRKVLAEHEGKHRDAVKSGGQRQCGWRKTSPLGDWTPAEILFILRYPFSRVQGSPSP